jgi:hypothetical protein
MTDCIMTDTTTSLSNSSYTSFDTLANSESIPAAGSVVLSEEFSNINEYPPISSDGEEHQEYREIMAKKLPQSIKRALLKELSTRPTTPTSEIFVPKSVEEDIMRKIMKKGSTPRKKSGSKSISDVSSDIQSSGSVSKNGKNILF